MDQTLWLASLGVTAKEKVGVKKGNKGEMYMGARSREVRSVVKQRGPWGREERSPTREGGKKIFSERKITLLSQSG